MNLFSLKSLDTRNKEENLENLHYWNRGSFSFKLHNIWNEIFQASFWLYYRIRMIIICVKVCTVKEFIAGYCYLGASSAQVVKNHEWVGSDPWVRRSFGEVTTTTPCILENENYGARGSDHNHGVVKRQRLWLTSFFFIVTFRIIGVLRRFIEDTIGKKKSNWDISKF